MSLNSGDMPPDSCRAARSRSEGRGGIRRLYHWCAVGALASVSHGGFVRLTFYGGCVESGHSVGGSRTNAPGRGRVASQERSRGTVRVGRERKTGVSPVYHSRGGRTASPLQGYMINGEWLTQGVALSWKLLCPFGAVLSALSWPRERARNAGQVNDAP